MIMQHQSTLNIQESLIRNRVAEINFRDVRLFTIQFYHISQVLRVKINQTFHTCNHFRYLAHSSFTNKRSIRIWPYRQTVQFPFFSFLDKSLSPHLKSLLLSLLPIYDLACMRGTTSATPRTKTACSIAGNSDVASSFHCYSPWIQKRESRLMHKASFI